MKNFKKALFLTLCSVGMGSEKSNSVRDKDIEHNSFATNASSEEVIPSYEKKNPKDYQSDKPCFNLGAEGFDLYSIRNLKPGYKVEYDIYQTVGINASAYNIIYFEGTAFINNHVEMLEPFFRQLHDRLESKDNKYRLVRPKIPSLAKMSFEQACNDIYNSLSDLKKKYKGPFLFISYSSGTSYALDMLRRGFEATDLILNCPVLNYSEEKSLWEEKLKNKDELEKNAKLDTFFSGCLPFIKKDVLNNQNSKDPKISPLFSTIEDLKFLKSVNIHLNYGKDDGAYPQQMAFYKMLKACDLNPRLIAFNNQNHGLFFMKVPQEMPESKIEDIMKEKHNPLSCLVLNLENIIRNDPYSAPCERKKSLDEISETNDDIPCELSQDGDQRKVQSEMPDNMKLRNIFYHTVKRNDNEKYCSRKKHVFNNPNDSLRSLSLQKQKSSQ